ncbi:CPBP family intramembrane glutamic endopeptidase [uncultured Methanobrevibacter sp.]|uniref:CPBP family intramembrane glutamic endopeptidase n=1 Tax=uncultured Methanobrevibacter sp. TaxID=253161 RepID=UPI002636AD16|nr:type II CAAX endopeptidase family protein [uncultured Methanobrevibacter sp.]
MDRSTTDFNVRLRTIKIRELAAGIIISAIVAGILMVFFPILDENGDLFFITLLFLVLLFFVWALKGTTGLGRNFENIFLPKTRNEILYVFALNIIFAFIFTCFIGWLDLFIGFTDPNWISIFDIDSVDINAGAFLLSAVGSIVFAPLLEELVFRGILFNRLKIRTGIVPAMIISSFIFAVGHDFGGMTSAFLFGLCMCILYLKTDNILVPMSVHCINNITATVLEITPIDAIAGQFPWLILTTIIVLIVTLLLIKYIIEETGALKKRFS